MPFPLLGSNSAVAGGYEIDNSLRFNDGDSAYLTKTPSSTGNRRTWTFSCWFKLSNLGTDTFSLFTTKYVNGESTDIVVSSNKIQVYSVGTSGYDFQYATSGLCRDVSAWYHIVVAVDTTQGTDSNRVKIYINGSQVTSFSTTNHPNQNFDTFQNLSGEPTYIGASDVNVLSPAITRFFDGYLSEIYMIDGTQYAASDFGETNDNGVWIPKDASGDLTFGTNGFYMEFKQTGTGTNSSGMGADTSGNDNHFAVTNLAATDVTTDTPTNNFCTLNSLSDISTSVTFSEGNTKASIGAGSTNRAVGNIGFTSGKWYYEVKYVSTSASASYLEVGFVNTDISMRYHVRGSDGERWDNGSPSSSTSYRHDPDDIIGVYIDADNKKWYIQVNGSNEDVGNGVADVSAGTGFVHQNFAVTDFILPYFANASGGGGHVFEVNFGNAPFSISSGNADANGYGNFEYSPTNDGVNFYALCTKNLAEYG